MKIKVTAKITYDAEFIAEVPDKWEQDRIENFINSLNLEDYEKISELDFISSEWEIVHE